MACQSNISVSNQPKQTPTVSNTVAPTPLERPIYKLNVTIDYDKGVLNTQERIEFINPSQQALSQIIFNVPPARHEGGIVIRDVRIFGQSNTLLFSQDKTVLTLQLPEPLPPHKAIALVFDFSVKLPKREISWGIGGDDSSQGPNSLIAGHWYILLAPYRVTANGIGVWDTPPYYPIGDSYTEVLADYDVSIIAPEDVIVAGAGTERREGRLWHYSLAKARVFAFAASKIYKIRQSRVNNITLFHYGYPQHDAFAEDVLITAERALQLYTRLYGKYPYEVLRIVENDRSQGQEYSGLITLGSKLYNGYSGSGSRHDLISSTAHEVAHQWWFHVVGNDQVRTPWLDEAFARMAEYRFYQTYYPQDADWWMSFYITSRRPSGAIDLPLSGYADSASYVSAIYQRGVLFLIELRKFIGDDAFDNAIRDYYNALVYKMASADQFFDAIAKHTNRDIAPLVRTYFASPPTLPCRISNNAVGCLGAS
jgi:hypothetical protein